MTKTTTPLHSDTAAVWGAFLFEGLMVSVSHPARATEILNRWGDSCTDLVCQACGVLPAIWNAVQPYWESQVFDRPGAFETEVISELGSLIGDYILAGNQSLPPESMLSASIESLVNEFVRDYEIVEPEAELSPELAAVWGAFLYEGLLVDIRDPERPSRILGNWRKGCIELITEACSFLPELWRQVEPRWNQPGYSFPGVFEYEVVSDFGTLLGDYLITHEGQLPTPDVAKTMIIVLLKDFFSMTLPPSDRHIHPR